jgi:hypothetical protein
LTAAGVALTSAQMAAEIGNIVIRCGDVTVFDADATYALARQLYFGGTFTAGILPIEYERPYLPTPQDRVRTALGMQNARSYTFEMDLAAAIPNLAQIEVYTVSYNLNKPLGEHIRVRRIPQNFAALGLYEVSDFFGLGYVNQAYLGLHIHNTTAGSTTSQVSAIVNATNLFAQVPANINIELLTKAGRVPQTNFYHVDFAFANHVQSRMQLGGVSDFRLQNTFTGAAPGNYNIYSEQLVDIDNSGAGFGNQGV